MFGSTFFFSKGLLLSLTRRVAGTPSPFMKGGRLPWRSQQSRRALARGEARRPRGGGEGGDELSDCLAGGTKLIEGGRNEKIRYQCRKKEGHLFRFRR